MKKFVAGLVLGGSLMLGTSVFAEQLRSFVLHLADYPIVVDGVEYADADRPILNYEGSTYIPLAKLGDLTGVAYRWNEQLNRVEIDTGRSPVSGGEQAAATVQEEGSASSASQPAATEAANKAQLYVEDGTGEYTGYTLIKGHKYEDVIRVYFRGNPSMFSVHYDEVVKKNLNETIRWTYKGKTYQNTRGDLYSFFSDTSWFRNNLSGMANSTLTEAWFQETFGAVYDDWWKRISHSNNATSVVTSYFNQINPTKSPIMEPAGEWKDPLGLQEIGSGVVFRYMDKTSEQIEELRDEDDSVPFRTGVQDVPTISGGYLGEQLLAKIYENAELVWEGDTLHYKTHPAKSKQEEYFRFSLPSNWKNQNGEIVSQEGIRIQVVRDTRLGLGGKEWVSEAEISQLDGYNVNFCSEEVTGPPSACFTKTMPVKPGEWTGERKRVLKLLFPKEWHQVQNQPETVIDGIRVKTVDKKTHYKVEDLIQADVYDPNEYARFHLYFYIADLAKAGIVEQD